MTQRDLERDILQAGIPKEALGTTLVRANLPELRAYVESDTLLTSPILVMSFADTLPFYLIAKELLLSGFDVACVNLVDVHTALFSDKPDSEKFFSFIEGAEIIAIDNFYNITGNVSAYFTPYEAAYFGSWFSRKLADGKKFVLSIEGPLLNINKWWPGYLERLIRKNCVEFGGARK